MAPVGSIKDLDWAVSGGGQGEVRSWRGDGERQDLVMQEAKGRKELATSSKD